MSTDLHQLLPLVPTFLLVFFRLAGMMLFAPLFGSARIPKRLKALLAAVLAMAVTAGITEPARMPPSTWQLAAAIGGEMAFGLAMGMVLSLVFIAAQWAGELIGQQMGLGLGEVFDPQFGSSGSILGEMYFMLTLVVFLAVGGHRSMLEGVRASFDSLPLTTARIGQPLFDTMTGFLGASTQLALRLAAPMLVTTLVVDLVLGLIGKTMPQMNVMAAGLTIRSVVGMVIVIAGVSLTSRVIREEIGSSIVNVKAAWTTPLPTGE